MEGESIKEGCLAEVPGAVMTSRAVKLKVTPSVAKECTFWSEDDSWVGLCKELSITVRGTSFEDSKRQMEAALQDYRENLLRKHSGTAGKRIA